MVVPVLSILIRFSIINHKPLHFGVPLFLETPKWWNLVNQPINKKNVAKIGLPGNSEGGTFRGLGWPAIDAQAPSGLKLPHFCHSFEPKKRTCVNRKSRWWFQPKPEKYKSNWIISPSRVEQNVCNHHLANSCKIPTIQSSNFLITAMFVKDNIKTGWWYKQSLLVTHTQTTWRFKQLKHTRENSDLKMDPWKFGDSFFCSAKNEAHGRTTRKGHYTSWA